MRSLVPVRDFWSSSNSGSHKKVCGCFCDSQWLFFGCCSVWKKIVCALPVRVMKDQYKPKYSYQLQWLGLPSRKIGETNFHSIQTSPTVDWYLLQLTFHEIWLWNTKWSCLKVSEIKSYIVSRGLSVFGRKKYFFLAVCLSKRYIYIKVPEVVFATSL